MTLLRVNKIGELERITDEEYRSVVPHHVVISLLGVKLYRESPRVSLGVCGPLFAPYSGKTDEEFRAFSYFGEKLCLGVFRHIMGYLEITIRPRPLGVHDALGDPLAVKMCQLLKQMDILYQDRPWVARIHTVLVVIDRCAKVGSQCLVLLCHLNPPFFENISRSWSFV